MAPAAWNQFKRPLGSWPLRAGTARGPPARNGPRAVLGSQRVQWHQQRGINLNVLSVPGRCEPGRLAVRLRHGLGRGIAPRTAAVCRADAAHAHPKFAAAGEAFERDAGFRGPGLERPANLAKSPSLLPKPPSKTRKSPCKSPSEWAIFAC